MLSKLKFPEEIKILRFTITKNLIVSGFKYVVVGLAGFALDYFLNFMLIKVIGVSYLWVGYINAPIVLAFNFMLNKLWSFNDIGSNKGKTSKQLLRYAVMVVIGAVMNMPLMFIFYDKLGLPLFWARVACTALQVSWNFPAYRLWVYKN